MASDERSRLRLMMNHWIEHNREHCREFEEWAEKARRMGEEDVAGEIVRAVRVMEDAGGILEGSVKKLEGV